MPPSTAVATLPGSSGKCSVKRELMVLLTNGSVRGILVNVPLSANRFLVMSTTSFVHNVPSSM